MKKRDSENRRVWGNRLRSVWGNRLGKSMAIACFRKLVAVVIRGFREGCSDVQDATALMFQLAYISDNIDASNCNLGEADLSNTAG